MRCLRSGGLTGLLFVLCASMLSIAQVVARGSGRSGDVPGAFDYYLMALSWSPSYCLTHPNETDQCGGKGYGFVLHGLWPQNRSGKWIQDCAVDSAPDAATIERTLAFMPSRRLIGHEWQTHGTCSGLDPQGYFELADRAFAAVKIPSALASPQAPPELSAVEIVRGFVAVNPGLDERMLSVVCHDGSELVEVRVCLDKDTLAPQACSGRVRNTCRSGGLKIPAAR
ncbi:MAG TPA: ribonuclease T2 [Rudaea sp.]|nr:ribonuclease T2 [Rudaea sp.]